MPTSNVQGGMRCCRRAWAPQTAPGYGCGVRSGGAKRQSALARARVDGVDRRPLRVSHRRLGLCVQRRRREGCRPHLPRAADPGGPDRSLRGSLGDRFRRDRVLLVTNATRIVLVGGAAGAVFLDMSSTAVYALSIAATIATTPFRSSQAALTPALAHTPTELTAANAVASGIESIAIFVGPAIAGILLGVASTGVVFGLTALMIVASTLFLILISDRARPERRNAKSWPERSSPRRLRASRPWVGILRFG